MEKLIGHDIICLSSVPWDYLKISNQQTMKRLSRENRVLFIDRNMSLAAWFCDRAKARAYLRLRRQERLRKESDNLFVFTPPFALPWASKSVTVNRINMLLTGISLHPIRKKLKFHNPIYYSYLPQGHFLAGKLAEQLICYEVIDEYSAFPHVSRRLTRVLEDKMLKKADLVFAISPNLHRNRIGRNPETYLVPIGAEVEHFARSRRDDLATPVDMENIPAPIIGYFGGIDSRFDVEMYRFLSKKLPECSFVLVGPVKEQSVSAELASLPNVYFLGPKPYEDLPAYLKCFDVSTLPYLMSPFTDNIFPNKIFEYLSSGKPVVSTPIPSLLYLDKQGVIDCVEDHREFLARVRKALQEDSGDSLQVRRIKVAEDNTWDNRVEKISSLIADRLAIASKC
jgi:glycosyltransferase involved in cell wall biosynthesis